MSKRGPLIFLAIVLAALLPSLLQIAWPFLTSFILASILAIVINPANQWLSRRVHPLGFATFLTTFATVILLGIIVAFAGLAITQELTTTYDALSRRSLEEGGWPALVTHTTDRVADALATRLPVNKDAIRTALVDGMKAVTGYLLKHVGAAIGGVTTILITGLLVTIFLYFLLRHGEDWIGRLAVLIPLDPRITASLFKTVHDSVVANVYGVLAVAAAQGLLLWLGFWFVGVRSPALWGAFGGLASIIPVVGSPLDLGSGRNRLCLDGPLLEGAASGPLGRPHRRFRGQRAAAVRGPCTRQTAPDAHRPGGHWRHVRIWPSGNSSGPPAGLASGSGGEGDSKTGLSQPRARLNRYFCRSRPNCGWSRVPAIRIWSCVPAPSLAKNGSAGFSAQRFQPVMV